MLFNFICVDLCIYNGKFLNLIEVLYNFEISQDRFFQIFRSLRRFVINKDFIKDKKCFINTRMSKKISINENLLDKLIIDIDNNNQKHEKLSKKYIKNLIEKVYNENKIRNTINNNESSVLDKCDKIKELNKKIEEFREKNNEKKDDNNIKRKYNKSIKGSKSIISDEELNESMEMSEHESNGESSLSYNSCDSVSSESEESKSHSSSESLSSQSSSSNESSSSN